ncbi:MAG: response regulator [Chloroflexota bacterium]|nr:response regulator [Chloroflexota bacterium]
MPQKPLVAVLDTSEDFMNVVTEVLDMEGYATVADFLIEFRRGKKDILSFLAAHQPDVIIYDIALPYQENWQFFKYVRELVGKDCRFVVVTTNKKVLDELVGEETNSLEIIGKPFDLDALLGAVQTSVEECI